MEFEKYIPVFYITRTVRIGTFDIFTKNALNKAQYISNK